jgi:hypothetical protein
MTGRYIISHHTPRRRGNQQAAAFRFYHLRLWNTGSPAFADDDSWECGIQISNSTTVIASEAKQSTHRGMDEWICFVALLLAMTENIRSHSRGANPPELFKQTALEK